VARGIRGGGGAGGRGLSWTRPAPVNLGRVWEAIRDRGELFEGAFAWGTQQFHLAQGGEVDPAEGLFASGRMFEVLGVGAIAGRTRSPRPTTGAAAIDPASVLREG
jgi:putative ABC transport system permease protein